jgi:hypothetical protein
VAWVTWPAREAGLSEQTRWVMDRRLSRLWSQAVEIRAAEERLTNELVEAEMSAASPQAEAWGSAKR